MRTNNFAAVSAASVAAAPAATNDDLLLLLLLLLFGKITAANVASGFARHNKINLFHLQ